MIRTGIVLMTILLFISLPSRAQELLLMDRFNDNKVVNDSVITIFSTDTSVIDLTKYFVMVNNTDRTLALFLRKTVHVMADSTTDYFCFGPKCWPDTDTTDLADSLQPGVEDFTFASHVVHVRRFDMPPLPPGYTSITYTIFDNTTFTEPIEARVTVNYHLSPVGIREHGSRNVSVYPNPARDRLTITTKEDVPRDVTLIICHVTGEVIMERMLTIQNGSATIPISDLVPGIYFGRIVADHGQAGVFRFLVVK